MQAGLLPALVELIRQAATDLPEAVESALESALQDEENHTAANILKTLSSNIALARQNSVPICQDTGTPIFLVETSHPEDIFALQALIRQAVVLATRQGWLRPNAVHPLSGSNSGDNSGDAHFPEIMIEESQKPELAITLMLKGGGCENVSCQFSLPDAVWQAERNQDGVRRVVLAAIHQAQGKGCAPGFVGAGIGGNRNTSHVAAKLALMDWFDPEKPATAFDQAIMQQANQLGIGAMGLGGKTTLLGCRSRTTPTLPASYFVSVAYMCWAFRLKKLIVTENGWHYV